MEWKKYSDMLFHNKKRSVRNMVASYLKNFSDIINIIVCK